MDSAQLAQLLVARGLVDAATVERLGAARDAKSRDTLADRVVAEGLVAEADLLRLVAAEANTRFVSSKKLEDLRLSAEAMDFVSAEAADELTVLPLSWDSATKTLSVVVGDLSSKARLDDLPRFAHVQRLTVYVGLPRTIRAAVRRTYFGEREAQATAAAVAQLCPQCAMPVLGTQLECGACGLLLNPDAPMDGRAAHVVRALLSMPSPARRTALRPEVHQEATRQGFATRVTDDMVPALTGGMEMVRSLSKFEAFVVAFIDGQLSVEQLAQATSLVPVEVASVLATLAQRDVVTLQEAAKVSATTQPDLAPVPEEPSAEIELPAALRFPDVEAAIPTAPDARRAGAVDETVGPTPPVSRPLAREAQSAPAPIPPPEPEGEPTVEMTPRLPLPALAVPKPAPGAVEDAPPHVEMTPRLPLPALAVPKPAPGAVEDAPPPVEMTPRLPLPALAVPKPATGAAEGAPPPVEMTPRLPLPALAVPKPSPPSSSAPRAPASGTGRHAPPPFPTSDAPPRFPGSGEAIVSSVANLQPRQGPRPITSDSQLDISLQAALALERRGETEAAIDVLKQAVARAPRPAPLFNRLALVLLHQLRDVTSARELLVRAIELEPDSAVFRQNLARVLEFGASSPR